MKGLTSLWMLACLFAISSVSSQAQLDIWLNNLFPGNTIHLLRSG